MVRMMGAVALVGAALLAGGATAAPRVAADIAPVHALAARVMQGVGEPSLLLPPSASPHGHAMRPSEARALSEADVVVWVGPGLTPWLGEALAAMAGHASSVTMRDAAGVRLLPQRAGALFAPHDHGHDDHARADGADHDAHAEPAGHDHDHVHDHDHDEGDHHGYALGGDGAAVDEHLWLDPANGAAFADAVAEALAERDPANAATYRANAAALRAELDGLTARLSALLAPVADRPFIVFHDAYQYFEARFGLSAAGAISLGDASTPSAARLAAVRAAVVSSGARCLFTEPQFSPRLGAVIAEGADVRIAALDPLGLGQAEGPDRYAATLSAMAETLADCLDD